MQFYNTFIGVPKLRIYSKERMKVIRSHIMKQNGDFKEGISQA